MRVQLNIGTSDVLDEEIEDDGGPANTDVGLRIDLVGGGAIELNYDAADHSVRFVTENVEGDGRTQAHGFALKHGEWAVIEGDHSVRVP
jgi:hypothetical protein